MMYSIILVLVTVFSVFIGNCQGMECQILPANYTFKTNSLLSRMDLDLRNCTQEGDYTTCYHPSTLTDSVIGGDNVFRSIRVQGDTHTYDFHNRGYYRWESYRLFQVLFTFPSQTTLTGITLYYYSDRNGKDSRNYGLPRLTFKAVQDDFEIQSPLFDSSLFLSHNDAHEDGEVNGTTKIKHFNVTKLTPTRKVVLNKKFKTENYILFALSEIKFFGNPNSTCNSTSSPVTTSEDNIKGIPTVAYNTGSQSNTTTTSNNSEVSSTIQTNITPPDSTTTMSTGYSLATYTAAAAIVIIITIIILFVIAVFVPIKYRKSVKEKTFREQASHPPQLQLSPLTGQVESPHQEKADETPHNMQNDNNESETIDPMYAAIDQKKTKKKKSSSESDNDGQNADQAVRVPDHSMDEPVVVDATYAVVDKKKKKKKNSSDDDQQPTLESQHDPSQATYAVVDKKKKEEEPLSDGDPPPIPQHTVDQLYAAVHKKQANNTKTPPKDNDDDVPPIPPHTMEELYTAVQKNTDEDTDPPPIPAYKGEDQ